MWCASDCLQWWYTAAAVANIAILIQWNNHSQFPPFRKLLLKEIILEKICIICSPQFKNIDLASMEIMFTSLLWTFLTADTIKFIVDAKKINRILVFLYIVHYHRWYLLQQSIFPKTNDAAMKSSGFHCSAWHHNFNRLYGYTSQGMDWEKLFWLWLHESLVANCIDSFPSQQILLNIKPESCLQLCDCPCCFSSFSI